MKWFRLYNETVQDRKLRRLNPAHRWLWIAVLCAASESEVRGKLLVADGEPVTAEDLSDMAALPLKDVNAGLKALLKLGMIAYDEGRENVILVPKWDTRQHKSDNSTQRWREWKEKQTDNDGPTLDQQDANVGKTYPPTATDTEADTENVSPNGLTRDPVPIRGDPAVRPQPKQRIRAPDEIFDTLCDVLNIDPNQLISAERGKLNRACKEIREVDGTPQLIRLAAKRYREKWPKTDMTARALASNWNTLLKGTAATTEPSYLKYDDWTHGDPRD